MSQLLQHTTATFGLYFDSSSHFLFPTFSLHLHFCYQCLAKKELKTLFIPSKPTFYKQQQEQLQNSFNLSSGHEWSLDATQSLSCVVGVGCTSSIFAQLVFLVGSSTWAVSDARASRASVTWGKAESDGCCAASFRMNKSPYLGLPMASCTAREHAPLVSNTVD